LVSWRGMAWNTIVSNRVKLQSVLFIVPIIMAVLTHIQLAPIET
jgi:hypothetical protein